MAIVLCQTYTHLYRPTFPVAEPHYVPLDINEACFEAWQSATSLTRDGPYNPRQPGFELSTFLDGRAGYALSHFSAGQGSVGLLQIYTSAEALRSPTSAKV